MFVFFVKKNIAFSNILEFFYMNVLSVTEKQSFSSINIDFFIPDYEYKFQNMSR